jgi:hypothetical protein
MEEDVHSVTPAPFSEEQETITRTSLEHEQILSGQFWGELRVFLAVAKAKSFNRAAEILNTSQPTVSRQVKRLQDLIGSQPTRREIDPEGARAGDTIVEIGSLAVFAHQRLARGESGSRGGRKNQHHRRIEHALCCSGASALS